MSDVRQIYATLSKADVEIGEIMLPVHSGEKRLDFYKLPRLVVKYCYKYDSENANKNMPDFYVRSMSIQMCCRFLSVSAIASN